MVEHQDAEDLAFPIDPAKLPRKLKLELNEGLVKHLKRLSQQSGRSIDEIIIQMLNDCLAEERSGN